VSKPHPEPPPPPTCRAYPVEVDREPPAPGYRWSVLWNAPEPMYMLTGPDGDLTYFVVQVRKPNTPNGSVRWHAQRVDGVALDVDEVECDNVLAAVEDHLIAEHQGRNDNPADGGVR
jgi:hypothetical protein